MGGMLIGLPLGLLVNTLRTGDCGCMERVICLLSLICGLGMLGGACSLGTHCVLWLSFGVVVSSNLLGFACKWACVVSTICCRSCMAREVLALPIIHWMALTQSASACINFLACVRMCDCCLEGIEPCKCKGNGHQWIGNQGFRLAEEEK
jgi:hypothetical protein